MEALRNCKKIITLLTVTVLFIFAFFNLILDAPRKVAMKMVRKKSFLMKSADILSLILNLPLSLLVV
jgi:hypothetical protein